MGYICLKPCHLMGKDYFAGDTIPQDSILPGNAAALAGMGFISDNPVPTVSASGGGEAKKSTAKKTKTTKAADTSSTSEVI